MAPLADMDDAVISPNVISLPIIDPLISVAICAEDYIMFGTFVFK